MVYKIPPEGGAKRYLASGLVFQFGKVYNLSFGKGVGFADSNFEFHRVACIVYFLFQVIDFGSGKGYLGSYLSLRYNISVLGIDAVSINTKSAEHRTSVVAKQWNGLTRNKDRENSNVKLTKKEKKVLKGMGSYQKNGESVTYLSDKESTLSKADKYKSVTMFIENFTDLRRLIIAHFPELPHRQKSCNLESLSLSDAEHGTKDNKKGDFENLSEISDGSFAKPLDVSDYSQSHLMPKMDPITSNDKNHEIKSIQDNIEFNVKCLLTGLHTCGNLASTSLDLFVHSPDLKAICTVGCCYHLLTEEFSGTEKRTGKLITLPVWRVFESLFYETFTKPSRLLERNLLETFWEKESDVVCKQAISSFTKMFPILSNPIHVYQFHNTL